MLSATAFMSFAVILWLVVAKLGNGNEEDEISSAASANDDETVATTTSKFPFHHRVEDVQKFVPGQVPAFDFLSIVGKKILGEISISISASQKFNTFARHSTILATLNT